MAWSIIPYHDEPGGPCKECKHIDCEASRRQVTVVCRACKKPIGFGAKFAHDGRGCAMHWVCLLDEADRWQAAFPSPASKTP